MATAEGGYYKEGNLFKRQRGLSGHLYRSSLIFQQRFCRLTAESLDYYESHKKLKNPNGRFPMSHIRIVETVPTETFKKQYCFQIGDNKEVMYLASSTVEERTEWMEAFRKAAKCKGNQMLPDHHPGVYQHNKWSCCNKSERIATGCKSTSSHRSRHRSDMSETYPLSESATSVVVHVADRKVQSLSRDMAPLRHIDDWAAQSAERNEGLLQVPGLRKSLRIRSGTSDSGYNSRPTSTVSDSSPREQRKHHPTSAMQVQAEEEEVSQKDEYVKIDSKTLPTAITSLTWRKNMLVVGSHDSCHLYMWDVADEKLSHARDIKVSGKVLAVDAWEQYVAIGSTVNQIVDTKGEQWKTYIIVPKDEKLSALPQHLVAFAPTGELAIASPGSDEIKLWPQPSETSNVILQPSSTIKISADAKSEHISCLSVSAISDRPWLAVGVVQGKHTKILRLINMVTKKCRSTFYAGNGDGKGFHIAFSPDGRKIAANCTPDLRIWEVTSGTLLYELKDAFGTTISSLCYSNGGSYVLVGTGTGEVKALSLNQEDPVFTLESPQNSSAATAVACSKDGKFLAVGHENGKLQLWKAQAGAKRDYEYIESNTIAELTFCNKPLFPKVEEKQFNSRGGECSSPDDGYRMIIPEGAIPKGMQVSIQHGVIPNGPFGPFQFPANLKPVSPIVGFSSNCKLEFRKPLQIILPHCTHGVTCEDVVFLKARHTSRVTDDTGEQVFCFEQIDSNISLNIDSASVDAEHMCLNCIATYDKDFTDKAKFCIVEAVPKHIGRNPFKMHFCVCYFLETCIKTCKEQLGSDYEFNAPKIMTFTGRGPNPAIKIQLKQQPEDGWTILHKNAKTISTKEVYFWDSQPHDLVLACQQKIYPPRFTLEVRGKNAVNDCVLQVEFQGANEELETEIFLSTDSGQEVCNTPAVNQQEATNSRPTVCTEDNPSTSPVPSTLPHPLRPALQPFANPCNSTTRDHQLP